VIEFARSGALGKIPAGDLEGGAEDLGSHEFGHGGQNEGEKRSNFFGAKQKKATSKEEERGGKSLEKGVGKGPSAVRSAENKADDVCEQVSLRLTQDPV